MPALDDLLRDVKVLPVLTVDDGAAAVSLCAALAEAGLAAVEITLRTPGALAAIRDVCTALPELIVGAGTVTDAAQLALVQDAGARFAVSPGMTDTLVVGARELELPLLPGVATPSEVLRGRELGLDRFKFFPAVSAGGLAMLKALADPLPDVRFCPTGGINADNAAAFLALPNVMCVGGTWLAPAALVAAGDWETVTRRAREGLAGL